MSAHWSPGKILFGGDVNPDQWSDDVLAEDIELMRRANVNSATIGVFSWSSIQPEPDRFEFGWLDRAMDRFADAGIGVILATPTASPPPWFSLRHPEALPVTADGVRLLHGSRDTYNPASAAYRAAARRATRALAERYADHPALTMWHLHNEYGSVSYGPETDAAFRIWLERRYGSLEELNRVWHTTFWSQGYTQWDQVFAPQRTQYLPNPTQMLDFRRFSADMLLECLQDQLRIVREVTPGVPATTNYILPTWLHFDHWAFARELDMVSIDDYPDPSGGSLEDQIAFAADLARSLAGGRPWLLMEQSASPLFTKEGRMLVREPGLLRSHTLQYISRGASGSLFFQWRAGPTGSEFFHSAMVPHAGPDSRIFREISALGRELGDLSSIVEAPADRVVESRVAIVWSADAWWALETRGLPLEIDYLAQVREIHAAAGHAGLTVDFVPPGGDLGAYDVVFVPTTLVLSDGDADRLESYARGGGHLAVWFLTGTADENLHVRRGGYSGAIARIAGIRVEEFVPLPTGTGVPLSDGSVAEDWTEVVHAMDAEVLVTHEGGAHPLLPRGAPAITRSVVGRGSVTYVSVRLTGAGLRALVQREIADAGVEVVDGVPVEVVRRHARSGTYAFAFNRGSTPTSVAVSGTDVATGKRVGPEIVLAPGDVHVIREDHSEDSPPADTMAEY
ncbi:beta-galactosidase [Microbacterium aoyamense]|uniref:Beta-galactosidase n=1 Tax=Microbacterium aoyamense TaxID=344166 RepID=A0ABN2PCX4_9MICO|nr:beta-galactosidase [Microbacterium aoyamense]